jgi:hypothetical protein
VKGKTQPIRVYELLARGGELPPDEGWQGEYVNTSK